MRARFVEPLRFSLSLFTGNRAETICGGGRMFCLPHRVWLTRASVNRSSPMSCASLWPLLIHSGFYNQTRQLVRAADDKDGLLEIHQRHRVIRMLKIRVHIIRRSAGETFDVRKIHDGFVELQYHRREKRNNPTIVIASVTAR